MAGKKKDNSDKNQDNQPSAEQENNPVGQEAVAIAQSEGAQGDEARNKAAHGWPLEADRLAVKSSLIECLRLMAGHYGRRSSIDSLTAGLPIPPQGITPALFIRAAGRVDLQANLVERSLAAIAIAPNLPCVLALEHNQACIVWDVKHPKGHSPKEQNARNKRRKGEPQDIEVHPETRFLVQLPETSEEKQVMTMKELDALYTGYAFFIRPKARHDGRRRTGGDRYRAKLVLGDILGQ